MASDKRQAGDVPEALTDLVKYIHDRFENNLWKVDESTKKLCHIELHPGSDLQARSQYEEVVRIIVGRLRRTSRRELGDLRSANTPPATFAAFFTMRREFLHGSTLEHFNNLWSLGESNRQLLSLHPATWAHEQTHCLMELVTSRTRNWVKDVCDVQPLTADLDELIEWSQWRAPRLLVMRPSKFAAPEPDRWRSNPLKPFTWTRMWTRFARI